MNIENPVNKIIRLELHMTQQALAEKVNVTQNYLNKVINGSRDSEIVKIKVSKFLNRPIAEIRIKFSGSARKFVLTQSSLKARKSTI